MASGCVHRLDISNEVLKQVNPEWNRRRSAPLLPYVATPFFDFLAEINYREEVSIRWHGNKLPENNTVLLTLGEFYVAHTGPSVASHYFKNVPTCWKGLAKEKTRFVCLELFVDCTAVSSHYDTKRHV